MLKNIGLAATAALALGGAVVGSVLYEQYALLVAVTAGAILLAGTRHKGGSVSFLLLALHTLTAIGCLLVTGVFGLMSLFGRGFVPELLIPIGCTMLAIATVLGLAKGHNWAAATSLLTALGLGVMAYFLSQDSMAFSKASWPLLAFGCFAEIVLTAVQVWGMVSGKPRPDGESTSS